MFNRARVTGLPPAREAGRTENAKCPPPASSARFCLPCCQPETSPQVFGCQAVATYAAGPLQTTSLVRESHPHSLQDMRCFPTLHCHTPV